MKKRHLLITILLILAFALFAMGSSEEPTMPATAAGEKTQHQTETTAATTATTNGFAVGEAAQQKDVIVTLVGVTESTGSNFASPAEGNVFVLCEFNIENNSSKELSISSMLSFEAYCDDYACSFSFSALLAKEDKNQLDGTVAPGKKLNGVVGYEVPADWKELEVHFTPDVWFGKSMIFIATND